MFTLFQTRFFRKLNVAFSFEGFDSIISGGKEQCQVIWNKPVARDREMGV